MSSLIPRAEFLSDPNDDFYYFPGLDLEKRKNSKKDVSAFEMLLPEELLGISEPTLEEQIAVLRYLALRIARVLYVVEWPDGLAWYQSLYEDTTLNDCLEVATAVLAALNATVVNTSSNGDITIDVYPVVDEFEDFVYDSLIPITHYLRSSNPDGDEDFEYDFEDLFVERTTLNELYEFVFFYRTHRITDLDRILSAADEDTSGRAVVAVNKTGDPSVQPTRSFDQPLDKIMLTIIGVIQFFKYSSEYGDLFAGTKYEAIDREVLYKEMLEYIEEFPDEEDDARESFEEEILGHINDYEFLAESAVFHDLGITSIAEGEGGWLRATLSPAADQGETLNNLGFYLESEDIDDPLADEEPVGLVRLGYYELHFFTPDDEETE